MASTLTSIADASVIFLLCIGVFTGLRTLGRHREFFMCFTTRHIFQGRLDALFYVLNSLSTLTSVVTLVLRVYWMVEKGWANIESRWMVLVLTMHFFTAISLICYHLITDKILNNKEFCQMCRRKM